MESARPRLKEVCRARRSRRALRIECGPSAPGISLVVAGVETHRVIGAVNAPCRIVVRNGVGIRYVGPRKPAHTLAADLPPAAVHLVRLQERPPIQQGPLE